MRVLGENLNQGIQFHENAAQTDCRIRGDLKECSLLLQRCQDSVLAPVLRARPLFHEQFTTASISASALLLFAADDDDPDFPWSVINR